MKRLLNAKYKYLNDNEMFGVATITKIIPNIVV